MVQKGGTRIGDLFSQASVCPWNGAFPFRFLHL